MLDAVRKAATQFKWREFALAHETCSLCGFGAQVRLQREEMSVRCMRCGASAVTQSLVSVLLQECADLQHADVYELSAKGRLVRWLQSRARSLTTSEFMAGVPGGTRHDGIACQDVQALTYPDASFDVCTSTEVFEHVEDDRAGFREILRVLRPGGLHLFSVPLDPTRTTIERTAVSNGQRLNVYPAEYHADRYRGRTIFCYRNYGGDILARLRDAGFEQAAIHRPDETMFGYARPIIVARKPGAEALSGLPANHGRSYAA